VSLARDRPCARRAPGDGRGVPVGELSETQAAAITNAAGADPSAEAALLATAAATSVEGTEPNNLWRICTHHHALKTHAGWIVVGEPGDWDLVPPQPPEPNGTFARHPDRCGSLRRGGQP